MTRALVAYLGAAVVFATLDATWLTLTGATLYRPALAPLLADHPRLVPAVLFYLSTWPASTSSPSAPAFAPAAG